ncbi:Bug family tripartite tricarboxylate transporter substrate binding protein [Bordetella genomosp. 11]|uniref:LacI family transcriptional regulator n=1 Tax=Bordetella genomosp. 11 TaxID=1416808 RepID=A0A261UCS1_9BORD|nr:tripartite tricarboxylate transporter substrate binding protein [Bordetella genomosp. 11]OZI59724.1 hypothetical protein CAL28_09445 [Bordetella genomosp. 11]
MSTRRLLGALFACLALSPAANAEYPDHTIRLVVPFAPGGAVDAIARVIAERISGPLGQSVIVDNRGGGGGIVGTDFAARANPDGYTLLMASASGMMITPLLQKLPYEPMKAFTPVALVGQVPFLLVSTTKLPPTNLQEFIAYAKERPGKLAYASAGTGTPHHVAGEMFKLATGTDLIHIPYKGTGPALVDVISGRVAVMNSEILAALPHVREGQLRALGIAAAKRSPLAPDIPTLKEAGLPNFEVTTWYGVVAPTGTPPAAVKKLSDTIMKALTEADTRSKLDQIGVIPRGLAGKDFSDFLVQENAKWTKMVKDTNIKID